MGVPAYQRVYDGIVAKIKAGEWKPGHRMPRIVDLAELFDVGTTTVKTAIMFLVREGWVRGQQGKALYVADEPPIGDE